LWWAKSLCYRLQCNNNNNNNNNDNDNDNDDNDDNNNNNNNNKTLKYLELRRFVNGVILRDVSKDERKGILG